MADLDRASDAAWAHTPRGGAADHATWESTIESVNAETADAFRARWDGLPVSYRRTLSAIAADDVRLLGKAAQAAHGTRPGASDNAARSLRDTETSSRTLTPRPDGG